MRMSA
jgi:hypothetical protein